MKTTKNWIASEHEIILPVEKVLQEENVVDYLQETVKPNDSVSQVGVSDVTQASTRRSQVSRTQLCHEYRQQELDRKQNMQPCSNVLQH